ncbi:MAG: flagellar hook-basal body complex protein FliE [Rhodospirillaceae bacterium]|nr:flagellar hook-basal body complex protein FliE [Rhodospirillaceae bacterium]
MAINPTLNVSNALQAYDQASRTGNVAQVLPAQDTQPVQSGAFAQLVTDSVTQAVSQGVQSEQMAMAGITDNADLAQVVTAISEADLALQTVVSIRDKVVEAYREILRMPM